MDIREKALARILEEAIGNEDAARDCYLRAAEVADDQELKKMLLDLVHRSLDHHAVIEDKVKELHLLNESPS